MSFNRRAQYRDRFYYSVFLILEDIKLVESLVKKDELSTFMIIRKLFNLIKIILKEITFKFHWHLYSRDIKPKISRSNIITLKLKAVTCDLRYLTCMLSFLICPKILMFINLKDDDGKLLNRIYLINNKATKSLKLKSHQKVFLILILIVLYFAS